MLPKLPLKSLSIRTFIEMLVQKYWSKKMPKAPPKFLFQKKAVLKLSSESTMRRCRSKHCQKFAPWKNCIELLVMNCLYGNIAEDATDNI